MEHAAIYMRLSKEDGFSDESNSISNQRRILRQYALKHGIRISAEFIDDGVSGTKWERAGLQEMLSAAEDGWINTVLIKDLSRLSRDYIHTGELLERWFPSHGIRLISVADHIDTLYANTEKYMSIRAVIDDWYARDISYKVRSALYARQAEYICTASRLPFGYQKNESGIMIQKEQAGIVKRIFALYHAGKSCTAIAKLLTELQIETPSRSGNHWNDNSVRRMLENPAYMGSLHIHVTERVNYKCNKKRMLPVQSHIILPVPSIIDADTFQKVQEKLRLHKHHTTGKHWLSGIITCGICGASMMIQKEGNHFRAICSGRKNKSGCTNRSCSSTVLLNLTAEAFRSSGLPYEEKIARYMIQHIIIDNQRIQIDLRYRKPTESELQELHSMLDSFRSENSIVHYV